MPKDYKKIIAKLDQLVSNAGNLEEGINELVKKHQFGATSNAVNALKLSGNLVSALLSERRVIENADIEQKNGAQ